MMKIKNPVDTENIKLQEKNISIAEVSKPQVIFSDQIVQGSDDAADMGFLYGTFDYTATTYYLAYGGAVNPDISGWRFQNVNVPKNATIVSALFTLSTWALSSGSKRSRCWGVAVDNLTVWSSPANRPKNATKTTAYADMNVLGDADIPNGTYVPRSFAVTAIIQEIVNRSGWVAGNSLGFVCRDNSSTFTARLIAHTYEDKDNYPQGILTIVYTV